MLISSTHREPSNEELGIRPYPKHYTYPAIAAVSIFIWYLIVVAF